MPVAWWSMGLGGPDATESREVVDFRTVGVFLAGAKTENFTKSALSPALKVPRCMGLY